jgi:AmiR/NasT family two-component response regulator
MWFYIIAIVSGINSLLQILGAKVGSIANIHFIFGLGVSQVVDAIAKQSSNGTAILLLSDSVFLGLLLLCGMWARQRSQAAFIAGMFAYALDGLLLLRFNVWLDAAVHAYALFRMWQGYAATRELAELDRAAQPGLSPVNLGK